jgi:uncharacterized protein (DUF58 family)
VVFAPRLTTLVAGGGVILFGLVLTDDLSLKQALAFLLVYNGVLALLLLADWRLTAKPDSLRVERSYEPRFSLGAQNSVLIRIENRGRAALAVVVKDEPPVSFRASAGRLEANPAAGSAVNLRYTLEPFKRGDYCFGNINFRYRSRLGFFLRQAKVTAVNSAIRVYPNIMGIRKYQLLARQGNLIEAGLKPSRVVGLGTDFESLRDYQVDDEYRRINWGATARRGRLVSNQYEVDKSQNILLVLDAGRMMSGEVTGLTKLDHAINASLLLGYIGVNRDDKVGLLAFADRVKLYIPPRKGQPQLQKILAGLYNLQPEVVESDYRATCGYIGLKNRKRSLVCVFTDLIDEAASRQLITCLSALARNHLVMCITLLDSSLVRQARKIPANSLEVYEKGVALAVLRNRRKAISLLRSAGAAVVSAPPEGLSVSVINKYLEIKSLARL